MDFALQDYLADERLELLDRIAGFAEHKGASAYLVGGAVRDSLLEHYFDRPRHQSPDLDVTLTLDLKQHRKELEAELGKSGTLEPRLRTLTLRLGETVELDLVTARHEIYPDPPHLPEVIPTGSISHDLARRDFAINTLAAELPLGSGSELLCYGTGLEDLFAGKLRLLHDNSFFDDPTRIARAAYYLARLDFSPAGKMRELAQKAVKDGYLDEMAPSRLREPLLRIAGLAEHSPTDFAEACSRLDELALLGWLADGKDLAIGESEWRETAGRVSAYSELLEGREFASEHAALLAILQRICARHRRLVRLVDRLELSSGWLQAVQDAPPEEPPADGTGWWYCFERCSDRRIFFLALAWKLAPERLEDLLSAYRETKRRVDGAEVAEQTGLSGAELGAEIDRVRGRVLDRLAAGDETDWREVLRETD